MSDHNQQEKMKEHFEKKKTEFSLLSEKYHLRNKQCTDQEIIFFIKKKQQTN